MMDTVAVSNSPSEKETRFVRIRRFLWTGPLTGALVHLLLFAWCLVSYVGAQHLGVENTQAEARVVSLFGDVILFTQLRILACYLAVGFVAGLVVRGVICLVAYLRHRNTPSPWKNAALTAFGVGLIHVWVVVRALVHHPHMMNQSYYAKGGLWQSIHVFVSSRLSLGSVDAVAWIVVAVLVTALLVALYRASRGLALRVRRTLVAGLISGALLVGGVAWFTPLCPQASFAANNLVILAVDSLRPDRINSPDDTLRLPHLSALADESVVFENAWTVMPRTFPSWVSLLTGSYPHSHGIRHMLPSPELMKRRYNSFFSTLKEKGYRTAVISDFAGDIFSRVELGFETVRVPRFTALSAVVLGCYKLHYHLLPYLVEVLGGTSTMPELKSWEAMTNPFVLNNEVRHWLSNSDGRPFALLVFYSTGHFPYAAPYPYYKAAAESGYEGPSRFYKDSWHTGSESPDSSEKEQIRRLYQGALRASDDAIGQLVAELRSQSLLETTHLLVTADHGERLHESTFGLGHGEHLFGSESLRVPLLFRAAGPSKPGHRVQNNVRTIDIAPTLLEQMDMPPSLEADGVSLLPLALGQARITDPPVFMESGLWFIDPEAEILNQRIIRFMDGFSGYLPDRETHEIYLNPQLDDDFLVAKHRAVVHDGYKLVYVPTRHGVEWLLFNLTDDPQERHDLAGVEVETLNKYKSLLKGWVLSDSTMMEMGEYLVPRVRP
ncbi:MAG TPA: hypothetical protein EYN06_03670 [Myxococcales bacterium]|nr:hypothetical protein [Myxococcales bacterium]